MPLEIEIPEYQKETWENLHTAITADRMNNIENGIAASTNAIAVIVNYLSSWDAVGIEARFNKIQQELDYKSNITNGSYPGSLRATGVSPEDDSEWNPPLAYDIGAMALGSGSKALTKYSLSGGINSEVNATAGIAFGRNLITSDAYAQAVFGTNNAEDETAKIVVGSGPYPTQRRNCFTSGEENGEAYITVGTSKLTASTVDDINNKNGYGMKQELLWRNFHPTGPIGTINIPIIDDLSEFSMLLIEFRGDTEPSSWYTTSIIPVIIGSQYQLLGTITQTTNKIGYRPVVVEDEHNIKIHPCYYSNTYGSSVIDDDYYLIPTRIFGIK